MADVISKIKKELADMFTSKKREQKPIKEQQPVKVLNVKILAEIVKELSVIRQIKEGSLKYDKNKDRYVKERNKKTKPENILKPTFAQLKPTLVERVDQLENKVKENIPTGIGVLGLVLLFSSPQIRDFIWGALKEVLIGKDGLLPEPMKDFIKMFVSTGENNPTENLKTISGEIDQTNDLQDKQLESVDREQSEIQNAINKTTSEINKTQNVLNSEENKKDEQTPTTQKQSTSQPPSASPVVGTTLSSKVETPQGTAKQKEKAAVRPSPAGSVSAKEPGTPNQNLALVKKALMDAGITNPFAIAAILGSVVKEVGMDAKPKNENLKGYANTPNDRIRKVFGQRASKYSDEELTRIKQDEVAFGEMVYGRATEMGRQMGNKEDGDGYKYRGRGYIGITGRGQYEYYSSITGLDLVKNPDLLNDPGVAATVVAEYVKKNVGMKTIQGFTNQSEANREMVLAIGGRRLNLSQGIGLEQLQKVEKYAAMMGDVDVGQSTAVATAPSTGTQVAAASATVVGAKKEEEQKKKVATNVAIVATTQTTIVPKRKGGLRATLTQPA